MAQALRLGIAGLGNAGQAALRDLKAAPGVALAAAADARAEALDSFRAKYPAAETFASVEAMCASDAVDAVWIATPNEFHAAHAVAAAANGKHVVCEKPMAVSLAECDAMIEAAARTKIKMLMHSKAGDPPVLKMREIVASGRLGRAIQINSWNYKGWLKSARLPSEVDTSKGGGVVFRQGAHQIDVVRAIVGKKITGVRAVAGKWRPRFDTEGDYTALLEFEDGTPATLVFNGYGGFDIGELTWGISESGYASSKETEESEAGGPVSAAEKYSGPTRAEQRKRRGERKQPFFGLTLVSCERGDIRQSPEGLYIYTESGREEVPCPPFLDRAGDLIRLREAVAENRPALADGAWGRSTLAVVLAILRSSRERHEIAL